MARKTARPGRALGVFFVVLAIVYGLVALGGTWKPQLGLDLQGGTRIQMIAKGHPSTDAMTEARDIISNRVNGSGITSATVTTQGSNVIVVEIPGQNRSDLVNEVSQTAQLRFRLVACESSCTSSTTNPTSSPSGGASSTPITSLAPPASSGSGKGSGKKRAPLGFDLKKHASSGSSSSTATSPSASTSPSLAPSAPTTPAQTTGGGTPDVPGDATLSSALSFIDSPPAQWQAAFAKFQCPAHGAPKLADVPGQPLITCDASETKYLLSPAIIEGTQVSNASYGIPQNQLQYVVTLNFHSAGNNVFADATDAISRTNQLFAITLDGQVISAATAEGRINGGAQISGGFTATTAKALATNLKFGALPVSFDKQNGILTTTVGPSLAGNQLSAGLFAGGIGLLLVMIYCLLYYRGLGVVVIGSLIIAGATIYGLVLLLSKTASFTLDLPGIAGLIVAVGITADSFIVYFERIRDEMRDGKSMRVAVADGWVRARRTALAADGVSLLAAVVLYVFAGGDVRGFAFALGLSTIVDLIIFFFFTHPLVQWLATYRFFNRGHRLSGLDADALGVESVRADNALRGGRA